MSSGSQMPGKGIITGYNDGTGRLGARYLAVNHRPRCGGNTAAASFWPSKCICPSAALFKSAYKILKRVQRSRRCSLPEERKFLKSRQLWVELFMLWVFFVPLLWKKNGEKTTTVKRLCKDSCLVFLSTPSKSSLCPCLTVLVPPEQRSSETACNHSCLPTSPGSERWTCIHSKPFFFFLQ